jgi:prolyl 4-hydroxylase
MAYYYLCSYSNFTKINNNSGYCSINDPYTKPEIINNLLTSEQCNEIINYSKDKLFDSQVVSGRNSNIRNSRQFWIEKDNPLVKDLFHKLSQKYNIPVENAESLQVVNYKPNQYYKEHHDACCDDTQDCKTFIEQGNNSGNRILTILIYLNDEFIDGETYFKNLDLKMKAPIGSGIVFYPLGSNSNKCHPLALHAGLPISSGEKWVCNIWFREREFR